MVALYRSSPSDGIQFTSERKPGDTRIPNYVMDLWTPILGATAIGVYAVYCRLERENVVTGMSQSAMASACRMSKSTLQDINNLLVKYGFIRLILPQGQNRLKHYTTEIVVLDPPQKIDAEVIKSERGEKYSILAPWLIEGGVQSVPPKVPPSTAEGTTWTKSTLNQVPPSTAVIEPPNLNPPIFADSDKSHPQASNSTSTPKTASQEINQESTKALADAPASKKDPEPTQTAEQELPKESSAKERVSPVLAQVVGATDPVFKESPYGHNSVSFTALTLYDCELAGELRFKAKADVWVEWGNWCDEVHITDREPARLAFFKGWDKSREEWNKARFEEIGKAPTPPDLPQPIPFLAIPPIAPTRPAGAEKYNQLKATLYYAVNHALKQVALSPAEQYVQNLSAPGWVHEMGIVIKTSESYLEYAVIPHYPDAPSLNGQGARTDDLPQSRPTTPETKQEPSGGVFALPAFANLKWYTCSGENLLVHLAKPTPSGQRLKPICGVKGHSASPVEASSLGNRQPCPDCQRIAAERAAKAERKRISLSPLQKAIGTCLLKQTSEATMDANRPRINTLQRYYPDL
jgi:hypothetical protein